MFGVDDALIAAGVTAASSLGLGMMNKESQEQTNQMQMAYNAAQSHENRLFQANMANTAYQRAMRDMKDAGLNPILAYQRGGAAVPSGSAASANLEAPKLPTGAGADAVNAYMTARMNKAQVSKTEQDERTSLATERNLNIDTVKKGTENSRVAEEVRNLAQQRGIRDPEAVRAKHDAEVLRTEAVKLARQAATATEEGARLFSPFVGGAKNVKHLYDAVRKKPIRSTVETTTTPAAGGGSSTFQERFQY